MSCSRSLILASSLSKSAFALANSKSYSYKAFLRRFSSSFARSADAFKASSKSWSEGWCCSFYGVIGSYDRRFDVGFFLLLIYCCILLHFSSISRITLCYSWLLFSNSLLFSCVSRTIPLIFLISSLTMRSLS